MKMRGIRLKQLVFTGANIKSERLNFIDDLNIIYGASNTGKSFALVILDFMLGGEKMKKQIPELNPYNRIWLSLELEGKETITLSRSTKGGDFEVYNGIVDPENAGPVIKKFGATNKIKNSLSQYLLEYLNLYGKKVATNKSGERDNISFRDLINLCLVDEGSIMGEKSPIETGDRLSKQKERRVFSLILTGSDDSDIIEVINPKKFATSKAAKIEVVKEMLSAVESEIKNKYPNEKDLLIESKELAALLHKAQEEFNQAQESISELLKEKERLSIDLPMKGERISEINVHIHRFIKLNEIYQSDIERLESIEEASFFLALEERACGVCGAPAGAQTLKDVDVRKIQAAAKAEINKIEKQQKELNKTLQDLQNELSKQEQELPLLHAKLSLTEKKIGSFTPQIEVTKDAINQAITRKDYIQNGIRLFEQRNEFSSKLEEYNKLKQPTKSERPVLDFSSVVAFEFCAIIKEILNEWEFPGENNISFDPTTYDIYIDGKHRVSNGKGVRAITHAAFKVAILIFCHRKNLPHPGFIILDSPLLTYRDPIKNPRLGELAEDEKALAQSNLKSRFFDYLYSISHIAQFIILENIDPPIGIDRIAHVETFYGESGEGRYGLFPPI